MAKSAAPANVKKLMEKMLAGERLALSRVLSIIERRDENLEEILMTLHPLAGKAHVLGITGPPGAGKSTFINSLIKEIRATGKRVAALAVDPSSPFTGGAILGDRIRMQEHSADEGVFIRSLGTRGALGGLSRAVRGSVAVLDASGFDVVIVETVGVGQSEWDIRRLAHTTLVTLVPESGDSIQVMKAGLIEIADLFVVNKADRPGAEKLERELISWVNEPSQALPRPGWSVSVHLTEATRGKGIPEVWARIQAHLEWLKASGEWALRERLFIESELKEILIERFEARLKEYYKSRDGSALLDKAATRQTHPFQVADKISKAILKT